MACRRRRDVSTSVMGPAKQPPGRRIERSGARPGARAWDGASMPHAIALKGRPGTDRRAQEGGPRPTLLRTASLPAGRRARLRLWLQVARALRRVDLERRDAPTARRDLR